MPTAFKIFLLYIFIGQSIGYACDLKEKTVSLSGPLTMVLEELDLLLSKNLIAISTFHPIAKKTSARIIAGGVFISKKVLDTFKKSLLYYDKSFELKKIFENAGLDAHSISSLGKESFAFTSEVINIAASLTENCEKKISTLKKQLNSIQSSLIKNFKHKKILFFVGTINTKLPELVMVNDGPMLFLKKHNLIKTYPSELAYVNWSQREMKKLKDYLFLGLEDGKADKLTKSKVRGSQWNVQYRGVFIPGIRQVLFLNSLNKEKF